MLPSIGHKLVGKFKGKGCTAGSGDHLNPFMPGDHLNKCHLDLCCSFKISLK